MMTERKLRICRFAELVAITIGILSTGLITLRSANGLAVVLLNAGYAEPLSSFLLAIVSPVICGLVVGMMTVILYKKRSFIVPILFTVGLAGWSLALGNLRVRMVTSYSEQQTEISPDLGFILTMVVSAAIGAMLGQLVGRLIMGRCLDPDPSINE